MRILRGGLDAKHDVASIALLEIDGGCRERRPGINSLSFSWMRPGLTWLSKRTFRSMLSGAFRGMTAS